MRFVAGLIFCLVSQFAFGVADYGREKKWADEVVPGIVIGDAVYLQQKNGHKFLGIYTPAPNTKMGLIVVHGIGIHPDWGMVGTLRQQLADQGYATLSIQMPILAVDAKPESYAATFPEGVERLQLAAAFLKEKGHKRIGVVSHSMGSRMAHAYMIKNPPEISAWASLGMQNVLASKTAITYDGIKVPVLDLYGANDLPNVLAGAIARKDSLKSKPESKQVIVPNTDHFFANHEEAMVKAVKDFLDSVK